MHIEDDYNIRTIVPPPTKKQKKTTNKLNSSNNNNANNNNNPPNQKSNKANSKEIDMDKLKAMVNGEEGKYPFSSKVSLLNTSNPTRNINEWRSYSNICIAMQLFRFKQWVGWGGWEYEPRSAVKEKEANSWRTNKTKPSPHSTKTTRYKSMRYHLLSLTLQQLTNSI